MREVRFRNGQEGIRPFFWGVEVRGRMPPRLHQWHNGCQRSLCLHVPASVAQNLVSPPNRSCRLDPTGSILHRHVCRIGVCRTAGDDGIGGRIDGRLALPPSPGSHMWPGRVYPGRVYQASPRYQWGWVQHIPARQTAASRPERTGRPSYTATFLRRSRSHPFPCHPQDFFDMPRWDNRHHSMSPGAHVHPSFRICTSDMCIRIMFTTCARVRCVFPIDVPDDACHAGYPWNARMHHV